MTPNVIARTRALPLVIALLCMSCGHESDTHETGTAAAPKHVFTFYRVSEFKSLDPVKQFDAASSELIANVYDTLLEYSYLERPYKLTPNLLTKMPELSADGLTYTFELRDDVRFQDDACFAGGKGRALITDDVIYSIHRFADANLNTKSYSLLRDVIEGMDAFREQTKHAGAALDYARQQIAGITKIDDRHFTIRLTHPSPLALFPFAATQLAIVPREAAQHYKQEFERHPVGSGPFRIAEMSRRGLIVLARNPRYHATYPGADEAADGDKNLLADAGKRLPLLDEVRLALIEEAQPAMLQFMNGQLDWVEMDRDNFARIAYEDASGFHLKPEYAAKYRISYEPSTFSEYFIFNMKDPLLGKNKALRQAFALAIDSQAFVDQMVNGRGVALTSIVPLPIAGSQRDVPSQWFSRDVEAAKRKLAEAGYPGGKNLPPITMEYRLSDTCTRQEYEFLRAQLAEVGIVLIGNFQSFTAFAEKVEVTGNFQMVSEGWFADYPDADNFFQLLYGKNKIPGPNASSYVNAEYDNLYEQSRLLPNGPERFALFSRMNAIVRNDVPVILAYCPLIVGLHQPWIKNFKRNAMIDMPFKYLDVDLALKSKGH